MAEFASGPPIGLVLAAGAGSRFGMPKALARTAGGEPWLHRATGALAAGGCGELVVVLGAMFESALHLVPPGAGVVVVRGWEAGQSASLRAGLLACAQSGAGSVVITLVDLPGLTASAVRRVAGRPRPSDLRRATYDGAAGHPVLIGRGHWSPLMRVLAGDSGAAAYLRAHGVVEVDCTDLGGGEDVDVGRGPAALTLPVRAGA